MDPDDAARSLDLRTTLEALADQALAAGREGGSTEPILVLLDVEERVLLDRADRALPDGPELTAPARARHRALLAALDDAEGRGPVDDEVADLLAGHVEAQRTSLYPKLVLALDGADREDLAAAIEEARLSREEHEGTPSVPLEP